ncbi:MAG: hypothetical protein A2289_09090 [Deltaproteobacteria bacterium RIFOXYA12_FULL_58_15]|nr:MAG: hypothetical protein A2289_09090 [Deltaproteobacteria bacterium RIFOXYA12_FULL_58_15]OGR09648.1 MAG: hypothetical protein A2341_14730 [Deltaproteobacteria bacterium RIFOXYB12_FULL_58_9]
MVELSSTIACQARTKSGKGQAHKLHVAGLTPAIAYGPGREPRLLALNPIMFREQRRTYGRSHIYDVTVDGGDNFKALIKDVQVDPVSRNILHVDLYAVDMKKPIRVEVRIEIVGKAPGVIEGGLLSQLMHRAEVQCLPGLVPSSLMVDVSELGINQVLHTDKIKLPEGVVFTAKRPEAVVSVFEPEAEEVVAVEVAAEGAVPADGAAAAAAAPAAGAKAGETEAKKE